MSGPGNVRSDPATARRSADETPTLAQVHGATAITQLVPGSVVANRYRIVSKLGRGGMGEVYRADDLKLGQTVALKFLAGVHERFSQQQQRQLIDEVRLGREVSHPNVCRLHDIGDVGGQLFISMEYIDGEDLASLLRRIGRLPGDKALALGREICAGLGAAHDRGIIHRDLKPANIMIDGRGRARITDFGLARAEGHREERGLISGTPSYMAPEQFEGEPASVASDLYALGLILVEIWSGRRTISGTSIAEIVEQHRREVPRQSLKRTSEIEGPIAAVIEKCLARDPAARPASATAILNALPGGDALDHALAAGETPSPAMVAAAGEEGGLSRIAAWSYLLLAVAGLIGIASLTQRTTLRGRASLPYSTSYLQARAQEIIQVVGRPAGEAARGDHAGWFATNDRFVRWYQQGNARSDASMDHAIDFVYRQSPRSMAQSGRRITGSDPPFDQAGMIAVTLTPRATLHAFAVVPDAAAIPAIPSAQRWSQLLAFAGLDAGVLLPAVPARTAPVDNDAKAAWTGVDPLDGTPIRIEAASLRGSPVWFEVFHPWSTVAPSVAPAQADAIASATVLGAMILLLIGALLLARRNLRLGQGDRRGATRLALFVFVLWLSGMLVGAHHLADAGAEAALLGREIGVSIFLSLGVWFGYIAVEPFVRRRWPRTLISWSRLLKGDFADPMVGRDVLAGLAAGMVVTVVLHLTAVAPPWFGLDRPFPLRTSALALSGLPGFASGLLLSVDAAVIRAAAAMAVFVFLKGLLRSQVATVIVAFIILGAGLLDLAAGPIAVRGAAILLVAPIGLLLLFRFGLLALVAETLVVEIVRRAPLTLDPSSWYFGQSTVVLLLLAALSVVAFQRSLGSKSILPGPLFQE